MNLSQEQQKIVDITNGSILVRASAGSGKTRVLTERIKKLLGITKRKVLTITFTNKAGEEILDRLKEISDIKKRVFIGTFHSFCQSVLESHGQHIGLSVMPHIFDKESDRLTLIESAIVQTPALLRTYKQYDEKRKREFRYNVLSFISKSKRELLSPDEILKENNNNHDILFVYNEYQSLLQTQNAVDYDDLLLLTYQLFMDYPQIASMYRRSFEFICIDEAQDLNYAQYGVLKALTNGEHKNVLMVGDPNQSIYAFNGSSSDFMVKNFVEDYSPITFNLNENYRSSRSVLRVAEAIIKGSTDLVNTVIEGKVSINSLPSEQEEAQYIVEKIKELIKNIKHPDIEEDVTYESIAVLARNKYVFKFLKELLDFEDIPSYYKMSAGAIKFESTIMKIFSLAFKIKLNPLDTLHLKEFRKMLKLKYRKISDLSEICKEIENPSYLELLNTVNKLNDDGSNIKKLLLNLKESIKIKDDNEKNLFYNDIEEFLANWSNYAKKTDKKSLLQFRNSMALGRTSPLTQHKGITLSTVHTMKGQEYDIVFIMGLDNETFPDYRSLNIGENSAEFIQEKNNLYVAVTRSKRLLYLTWPESRQMPWGDVRNRKISCFLSNIDINELER